MGGNLLQSKAGDASVALGRPLGEALGTTGGTAWFGSGKEVDRRAALKGLTLAALAILGGGRIRCQAAGAWLTNPEEVAFYARRNFDTPRAAVYTEMQ